ncbi:MAG: hypothetical protein AAF849_24480, partial [Bacteroidota bacterium]
TADSAKRLATTGESAIYSIFNIKNNFVINTVRGIIFLIIGSIALPLSTTVRLRIGERSIDGVKFFIGYMIVLYIGLFGFSLNPIYFPDGKGFRPVPEDYENIELYEKEFQEWDERASFLRGSDLESFLSGYFPNINFSVTIYFVLIILMRNLHSMSIDKEKFVKRHSYYRGKTFWHLFNIDREDESLWIADAVVWILIGFFVISSIDRFLALLVMAQAIMLLIEEIAVKRKKRHAVLDIIDAEIESKIINEYRAKFVTKEESVRINRTDKVEDVELA